MSGMVEKRGLGIWLTHLGLIIGIAIICFPIYMAFVASTVTQPEIARPPMPLLPGGHFIENYTAALTRGVNSPVLLMLFNSSVMALGITILQGYGQPGGAPVISANRPSTVWPPEETWKRPLLRSTSSLTTSAAVRRDAPPTAPARCLPAWRWKPGWRRPPWFASLV